MKFLIDECLHTSLVGLAHESGFAASHVTFLGLAGARDRQIIATAIRDDYALVTNDRSDFLTLYRQRELHAGLIILVPNVTPPRQRELFQAVLAHIGERILVNAVIEVEQRGLDIVCSEYSFPKGP